MSLRKKSLLYSVWAPSCTREETRSDLRKSYDICIWQPWRAGGACFGMGKGCLRQGLGPLTSSTPIFDSQYPRAHVLRTLLLPGSASGEACWIPPGVRPLHANAHVEREALHSTPPLLQPASLGALIVIDRG